MREAARETSAKREADACPTGHLTFRSGACANVPVPRHTESAERTSSPMVRAPEKTVLLYCDGKTKEDVPLSDSTFLLLPCPLLLVI